MGGCAPPSWPPSRYDSMTPFFGILLALACALATNVGFLYKHRGACAAPAVDVRRPIRCARSLFASPMFEQDFLSWVASGRGLAKSVA